MALIRLLWIKISNRKVGLHSPLKIEEEKPPCIPLHFISTHLGIDFYFAHHIKLQIIYYYTRCENVRSVFLFSVILFGFYLKVFSFSHFRQEYHASRHLKLKLRVCSCDKTNTLIWWCVCGCGSTTCVLSQQIIKVQSFALKQFWYQLNYIVNSHDDNKAHTCIPPTCTLILRLKEGDILYRMCAAQTTSLRIAEERMTISISKNKTAASQTSHLICVNSRNLEKFFIFSQNAKKRKSKGEKQEFKQTIHSVKQINTFHCAADINAYKNTRCSN